jgi:hypothetical protein
MQRAQDAVADIKAMITSGLAGTAQFTMLFRSMQFRLSHHWKAHPARLCADAAVVPGCSDQPRRLPNNCNADEDLDGAERDGS